jgi:hypothetical protein
MVNYIRKHLEICKSIILKDLEIVKKDIKDFSSPKFPIEERIRGRLSAENLTKNYRKKLDLEEELQQIEEYFYYNKLK